jgi:restriction system protein
LGSEDEEAEEVRGDAAAVIQFAARGGAIERQLLSLSFKGIASMADRQGLLEDLMNLGLKVPARVGIALAGLSWMILHVVASQTVAVVGEGTARGVVTISPESLIHLIAAVLQYVIPFCLLIGVLASVIRRRRAMRIFENSRDNPRTAVGAMNWRDFERLVGALFRQRGFEVVELAGNGPDGGVDLVLTRDGKRYLAQCKHWKAWEVGVSVVRELNGVLAAQKAHGGYVITGGRFTRDAMAFADSCGIKLIDGLLLEKLIKPPPADPTVDIPRCPDCGSAMVEKVANQGQFKGQPFWSCVTYPKCRGKVHIDRVA